MHGHKIANQNELHFLTLTTVGWIDIFSRQVYKDILLESLKFCQENKGLLLFAYVIMSNHLHLIACAESPNQLSEILRDFKKYTAKQIIEYIKEENKSRKDWLLHVMSYYAKYNKNNRQYQCWQQQNHPIELESPKWIMQKLDYIHLNPVRAGIVDTPEAYRYSSARNYAGQVGLLKVKIIDRLFSTVGYLSR